MNDTSLSKSNLIKVRRKIKTYNAFLPALNLKQQQLLLQQVQEERYYAENEQQLLQLQQQFSTELPMVGAVNYSLAGIVKVKAALRGSENVVGVRLPTFQQVVFAETTAGKAAATFWIYRYIELMQRYFEFKIKQQISNERLQIFKAAVLQVTQKINLFEKVLLPKAQTQVKKINIFLADAERAAVVRSKIAKRKRQVE